jgi:LCP family protein required for cell wall assembly
MRDGDNATPDRRGMPGADGDNPWLTRSPRPSRGAAPWERRSNSAAQQWSRGAPRRPPDDASAHGGPGGNHGQRGTVTVADLIAKVGAKTDHPTSHRVESESVADPTLDAITEPIAVVPASDVPDLTARARREWARGATTQLPAVDLIAPRSVEPTQEASVPPRNKGRRRVILAGRSAAALIAVLALAMTGSAYQWQESKNQRLNHVSALDPGSRDIVDPTAQYGDENFLIVGVDSRAGANSDVGAGDQQDAGGARSDTVMLVNIPANRKRVVAVSFPRDLAITPMKCQAWNSDTGAYGPVYDNQTGSYGPDQVYTETKLNSAYAFGGPKCLVKVIQKISGLSINRFMAVDFVGFEKMVDAMGGVEVCSTTPLADYELGTVLEHAGRQMVDGKTALNYVRARQVTTEVNGDYGRIKRQQLFLSALLRSLISKEVLFSLSKLNNVVNLFINDSSVDNIQTKDLVDLGQSLQKMAAGRITFMTVPTTGETDADGNEPLRQDDTHAIFSAIINDDALPGENNNNATTTPKTAAATPQAGTSTATTTQPSAPSDGTDVMDALTTEPHDVTVQISNSTGKDGLATTAADELQQHGFNVLSPDDYPNTVKSTTVFFSPGNEQAAATVASSLTNPQMERVSGMGNVVQVVLGPDFYSVSPPPPSGSSVRVHVTHGTGTSPTRLPEDLSVTNAADTSCN